MHVLVLAFEEGSLEKTRIGCFVFVVGLISTLRWKGGCVAACKNLVNKTCSNEDDRCFKESIFNGEKLEEVIVWWFVFVGFQ